MEHSHKVNRLETHDRLQHFLKQKESISEGCVECIRNRPEEYGALPFYIFAHKREIGLDERSALFATEQFARFDQIPTHRMIWMPRLKKPKSQENSMLFKYYPREDIVKVIWMIPEREVWDQFTKGQMCENNLVSESIFLFMNDKKKLEDDEPDDISDAQAAGIAKEIGINANKRRNKCQYKMIAPE